MIWEEERTEHAPLDGEEVDSNVIAAPSKEEVTSLMTLMEEQVYASVTGMEEPSVPGTQVDSSVTPSSLPSSLPWGSGFSMTITNGAGVGAGLMRSISVASSSLPAASSVELVGWVGTMAAAWVGGRRLGVWTLGVGSHVGF